MAQKSNVIREILLSTKNNRVAVKIERGATILKVGLRDRHPVIWYLCNPDEPKETRVFGYVTNDELFHSDRFVGVYVGTVQIENKILENHVAHVLELKDESEGFKSYSGFYYQNEPKPRGNHVQYIIGRVKEELRKAKEKHPDWPDSMFEQVTILQEEAGEVSKAVLHYHHEGGSVKDIEQELMQTAAMCIRMAENLKIIV